VLRLPKKEAVLRQENITLRDLPARSASVLIVVALSAFYLPLPFVIGTVLIYLVIEVWGILSVKWMLAEMRWLSYLSLLCAATIGSCVFLNVLYEMWQLEGLAPKLFTFCSLTTALIHCATVRSYHLPLAIVTGTPVVATIALTIVSSLIAEDRIVDTVVGMVILMLMIGYITVMMIEGSRSRRVLIAARTEADAANEAKGRFMATLSHEIRTPLNGILGIAQLMKAEHAGDFAGERADILYSSAVSLKTLVDDVLDHEKVEAGKLTLKPVPGDLREVANSTIKLFAANAEKKGLYLRFEVDDDVPARLMFDPVRLRQILSNLITNAIKFTDKGGVRLDICVTSQDYIRIEVRDTGIGIPKSAQSHLFSRYSQVDEQQERAATGTGLGLAISLGLAELMGGTITVDSCAGRGSIFALTFPMTLPDTRQKAPETSAEPKSFAQAPRILVVDDNAANRFIARSFLEASGAVVEEAEDGEVSVQMAANGRYDVIFMDLQMPVMDGYSAAQAIRAMGHGRRTAIIALTADSTIRDQSRFDASGMNGFLSKPLQKDRLLAEVARHLPPALISAAE
jgi:signal transduction histidine kinase/CheY-like chemotaxis protein